LALSDPLHIVVNKNTPYVVQAFSRLGKVTAVDTPEVTPEVVRDADLLVVRSETKVDRRLLDNSRVRFVGTVTIGTDHVDLEYLSKRGIVFASAPGSNANSVAEYVAAALLRWSVRKQRPLSGLKLGVVGVGNVGSKVVRVAQALGMTVLQNDPPRARAIRDPVFVPLDALMECDVITLHVPLTRVGRDPTFHLFDESRFRKMKRSSILLNTARGAVVETRALTGALRDGHVSDAILDVWENEPAIDLELLSRVSLATPHIAGHSLDGKVNAVQMIYEAACRFVGLSDAFDAHACMPEPENPLVQCPSGSDPAVVLDRIVSQCYDIARDDRNVRQLSKLAVPDRSVHFMRLRAEYRVRYEFPHYSVSAPPAAQPLIPVLRNLGFKVRRPTNP